MTKNKAKAINIDKLQFKKTKDDISPKASENTISGVHKNKPIICPMPMRKIMNIVFTIFPPITSCIDEIGL
ncbi:hypothetical protein J43TS3_16330 [Ornithinibacillus bavariensis]|uniref:Uncharacterized protein n=1 Tax=Ornithinibacillus bavariensis TaxID=545502 RepID=A0A919X9T8_9BACI|nr:hypothetical protein J43TS3_16330 [Ornithinibacillus bavariensis]